MTNGSDSVAVQHPTPLLADLASRAKSPQQALFPGNRDPVGYWLTPPEIMDPLQAEFRFDFDACPFPRPAGFDGLKEPWGQRTWVNPPWEGDNRPTAWARKCIAEAALGKTVAMIFPMDKWVLEIIAAGGEVRPMPVFRWMNPKGERQPKGSGRGHALFVLDSSKKPCDHCHGSGKVPK